MRGDPLNLKSIIEETELRTALIDSLSHYFAREVSIQQLTRRISEYCSSFIIEELDVVLTDGTMLALILKDLSQQAVMEDAGRVKPKFVYDPMREIETYRQVLANHQFGSPVLYGAKVDPQLGRYWLLLERVPPVLLWQMGDIQSWQDVARWLAGMHSELMRETEGPKSAHVAHLLIHDRNFYWSWMQRAVTFVSKGDQERGREHAKAIRHLESCYEKAVDRLCAMPHSVIHGEFFASNILLDRQDDRMRICPVDWEMAALGPGLTDLAGLTSGKWSPADKLTMATAYYEALPESRRTGWPFDVFLRDLECCRLQQAIQWLGWSPEWSPPPEHAQNWLKEAMRCADIVC